MYAKVRPSIATICVFWIFIRAIEAPSSDPDPTLHRPPPPLPELVPPSTLVHLGYYHRASHDICRRVLLGFTESNRNLCQRLRTLIGDSNVVYQAYTYEAIVPWGARLCTDPELPNDEEYNPEICDAAFFCRVMSNYHPCPQSLLQGYLGQIRFRLRCTGNLEKAHLQGDQPDTTVGCYRDDEWRLLKEKEFLDREKDMMRKHPDSKVFEADGSYVYARPAPYTHPRFTCMDYQGTTRKHEL